MTTTDTSDGNVSNINLDKLNGNLLKVEELSQRLTHVLTHRSTHNIALDGPNQEMFTKAAAAYWSEMLRDPAKVLQHQLQYWSKSVTHFVESQKTLVSEEIEGRLKVDCKDKRFSNPLWKTHPYFSYVKNQYFINAEAIEKAMDDVSDLDAKEKQRLAFFSRQIVDMMSPTNFLGTNPDALEKAVATEGQSLVQGLENLISDLEANNGELIVKLADDTAFKLGGNIAMTIGKVVFRNRMMELIQYSPTTKTVHETPVVLFPPWINKFYILDLKEQNSLVRWIID